MVGLVTPYLQGLNNPEVFGQHGCLLLSWVVAKRWLPYLWPDCSGSAELPVCSDDFIEGRRCSRSGGGALCHVHALEFYLGGHC